jgi:type III pantothenate kinase
MVIAIDAGNSALKAAVVEGDHVGSTRRIATGGHGHAPGEGVRALLEDLSYEARRLARDGDVVVSLVSVVPAWTAGVRSACDALGIELHVATPATIPLPTRLATPDRTGADRLLAAWAARERRGSPVIVVDLGTATTVDAVDRDGHFAGGAILPGVEMGVAALATRTAQLPHVTVAMPASALGLDTASAIRSGTVLGHLGAIRELVARMSAELDAAERPAGAHRPPQVGSTAPHVGSTAPPAARPAVIVTGGMSGADWAPIAFLEGAAGLPPIADSLDPLLVLRGLGAFAVAAGRHSLAGARS